jgi:seryl-tRNA synthetase
MEDTTTPTTPSTPSILPELVKEWVHMDSEISQYQKRIRVLNGEKKELSKKLLECMKQSQIEQITLNGEESILYKKSVSKKPVNKKSLDILLQQYLQNTDVEVNELLTFIFDNRESVEKESIVKKKQKM